MSAVSQGDELPPICASKHANHEMGQQPCGSARRCVRTHESLDLAQGPRRTRALPGRHAHRRSLAAGPSIASRLRCVLLTRCVGFVGSPSRDIMWVLRGLVESGFHRATSNLNKQISSASACGARASSAPPPPRSTGRERRSSAWAMVPPFRPRKVQVNSRRARFREPSPCFADTLSRLPRSSRQALPDQKTFPKGRFGNLSNRLGGHTPASPGQDEGTLAGSAPTRVQRAVPMHPACSEPRVT